ncbi:MAG TPA: chitobiase/beta-hexosaminidase C-terminal domain-containing protein, partial [Verrucomicrobiae bacterium]|nr:chitobiase/beta-hexosaminidase C-terminal domain-containing protein [Verrucomicrobiae bacterium]
MIKRIIVGLCIAMTCGAAPVDWPHLKLTQLAETHSEAVCITRARDGSDRLFIALRYGQIKVIADGQLQTEPFLDISSKLENLEYSYGVPGLAFPPNFAQKQYLYVLYARNYQSLVLSRFHVPAASAIADVNSEEVLMRVNLPFYPYLHGGYMDFGPDGYLYIGFGEPESYSAQALDNIGGKILRIDTESTNSGYVIPPGNPFAGHSTYRNEIWCWGLMIPWSFSFDRLTGDFFMVDKLVSNSEINYAASGKGGGVNYGWPGWDAPSYAPTLGSMPPILMTAGSERSVGGIVSRGPQPSRMDGIYILGGHDFPSLAGLARDGTNWVRQNFSEVPTTWADKFGQDDSGRLYMLSYQGDYYGSVLYRIEDSGKARPPIIYPPTGVAPTSVGTFSLLNPGARIRYTTNGVDPQPGDLEVAAGHQFPIQVGATVKAQAIREDLLPSDVITASYTALKVAYPVFTPPPGAVTNPTLVTLTSTTPAAVIRYTRDGTRPTLSSPIYGAPLVITSNQMINARAYRAGFQDSDLNGASYELAKTEAPTFMPDYSPITNRTLVSLFCTTPGAVIRYTTNGLWPTRTSPKYTGPFRINGNTLMRTRAFAPGYLGSDLREAWYALVPVATPVLEPASGPVPYGSTVRVTCATPGAVLRYTTNGSEPTATSPVYSQPFKIYDSIPIRVRGYKAEHNPSEIASEGYYLQYA